MLLHDDDKYRSTPLGLRLLLRCAGITRMAKTKRTTLHYENVNLNFLLFSILNLPFADVN